MGRPKKQDSGRAELLALQIDALYKSAPSAMLSIAGALIAALVYWAPETQVGLVLWFTATSLVALVHVVTASLRKRGLPSAWSAREWERIVVAIYLAAGLCWGVGGAWLLGQGNEHQALVICCLAMGAVTSTFPAVVHVRSFNVFQVPVLVSMAVGLAASDLRYGLLLGVASLLLSSVSAIIARGLGQQLTLALRLSDENRRLAEDLRRRGDALEAANGELTVQNVTDPLTGVANRRGLMSALRAQDDVCALLIVDVDHFKLYNDSFGHNDGDICLVLVADALKRSVRNGSDLVARHGGEEFAIVLPGADPEEALAVAERVCRESRALHTRHVECIRRNITVSVGIALRGPDARLSVGDLMARADAAVYEAKRAGRDRVVAAGAVGRAAA